MSKKKRSWLIFIIVCFLLASGYFVKKKLSRYNKKWGNIEQSFMADFMCNGKPEMLIIYDDFEKKSAMKLVDVESGKRIWSSYCRPSHINDQSKRIYFNDSIFAIAYYDRQNDTSKNSLHSLIGVEAFNSKNGNKLWDHQLNWKHSLGIYFWMFGHENRVFAFTNNYNKNLLQEDEQKVKSFISCIDLLTGEEQWQVSVPDFGIKAPEFSNNRLFLHHSEKLYTIDIKAGKLDTINPEAYHTNVFAINDSSLYYILGNKLYKHDSLPQEVILNNAPVTINNIDSALYYRATAIYQESIISINDSVISSTPFAARGKSYHATFEKGYRNVHFGILDVISQSRKLSPFHIIEKRYIPIVLRKDTIGFDDKQKLCILDLYSGKTVWESKLMQQAVMHNLHKHIVYYKGYYLLNINTNDDTDVDVLLVLNGETAKFHSVVKFSDDELVPIPCFTDGFSMFYDGYHYQNSYKVAWCMKFPEMELVYSTKKITTKDAKAEVETLMGKMPWDTKSRNNE